MGEDQDHSKEQQSQNITRKEMIRYYMENIAVICVLCGHRNQIWIPRGNHSKDNDLRFDDCQNCGAQLEEE